MNRRGFLKSTVPAIATLGVEGPACAAAQNAAKLPAGIGVKPDYVGPIPRGNLGDVPALRSEVTIANRVIAGAPTGPDPYSVAKYFLAVGSGAYGQELTLFTYGWPERWNPVIVDFFQATKTQPEGDLTPWCAAFVNWCFLRALKKPATESASSGSFRCQPTETSTPVEGDLVVFRRKGDPATCNGQGHVGFFVRDVGDRVEVLGGNQIDREAKTHKISQVHFLKNGIELELHSYRSSRG